MFLLIFLFLIGMNVLLMIFSEKIIIIVVFFRGFFLDSNFFLFSFGRRLVVMSDLGGLKDFLFCLSNF